MKRRQTFLKIAKAFGTPIEQRIGEQYDISRYGICNALKMKHLHIEDSFKETFKPKTENAYWWPARKSCFEGEGWSQKHDDERSLFCCFIAALTDNEYDEMVEEVEG